MNKFTVLLVTLFAITASFFVGFAFGKEQVMSEIQKLKESLQVSLSFHGNILDVEKSTPDIRVIVNGESITGSGSVEIKK